ncbi:MAG: FHA domain-containing protein [Bacteriovoracia bacterium]
MKINLKVQHNNNVQECSLSLGQILNVGRSRECDLKVDDDKLSGQHCRFYLKKDKLEITDLDSKNGTYLNGIRIEQSEVFVGDQIRVGATLITLVEKDTDDEALRVLTFPGPFNDRMSYELKMDFTGARIQNQLPNTNENSMYIPDDIVESHKKEVTVRKKVKSKIKLSKQEIRNRHKLDSHLATFLDAFFFIGVLCLPMIIVQAFEFLNQKQKLSAFAFMELMFGLAYFSLNFKIMKFSIGEVLTGIKTKYNDQ